MTATVIQTIVGTVSEGSTPVTVLWGKYENDNVAALMSAVASAVAGAYDKDKYYTVTEVKVVFE